MIHVEWCRHQFPALQRQFDGHPVVYFDGPGGSQAPERVLQALVAYLSHTNANRGGLYATSRESDELLDRAHAAVADLIGAQDPECVVFGANMTTLTLAMSRALSRTWSPGDEILVTRLDHDANVTPWVLAARDAGATVKYVDIHLNDCTLNFADLREKLSPRTKLVAVGCASNLVGTINPVGEIARLAHAVGALVYLDAVHYVPHALADVTAWDCDFLACSAYKFFGPHVGILWARRELLESLPVYKVRPSTNSLPGKWMTGTQNHEGIAGTLAAIEYLTELGRMVEPAAATRREALAAAYREIGAYERKRGAMLLEGLADFSSIRVLGITDPARLNERTPTISFVHARHSAAEIAEYLGRRGLFVGHGNFYALQLTEALDLEPEGVVRIGLMHYNTGAEIARLLADLSELE